MKNQEKILALKIEKREKVKKKSNGKAPQEKTADNGVASPKIKNAKLEKIKKAMTDIKKSKKKLKATAKGAVEPSGGADESMLEVPSELVTRDLTKNAVKAAKAGVEKEKEGATTKHLFDDETRYGLQVVAAKIPKTPPHTKKIMLKNSLFGDEQPDICFIIRDSKAKKTETIVEETILAFEAKLTVAGVTVKTILPLSKLKKDFGPNNMKMKLLNTYDLFLVESEIAEHTYQILGKHFIKKRKRPLQIDTSKTELMKTSIENAQRKVSFKVSSNSNMSVFEIGTHKMENSKIVENIETAVEQLKEKWPGGWKNILRLYLKPMKSSKVSIPLYYSKLNANQIEVPVIVGAKRSRLDKLAEQLAKKSKKLRLDRKTNRIVKAKAPGAVDKAGDKKNKKRKSDDGVKVEGEAPKAKKIKKQPESEVPVVAPGEGKKKKKKDKTEVIAEPEIPDKKADKKKIKAEAPTAVEVKPEPETSNKKADKKKRKAAAASVEPPAELEKPKKKPAAEIEVPVVTEKSKKKKKEAAVVEAPAEPEKKQKKKKNKI